MRRALGGLVVVAVAVVIAQQVGLRDLRRAEDSYIAGRQVTSCATKQLAPFAERSRELDELPAALEEILLDATKDTEAVRADADTSTSLPFVRGAVDAVDVALDAEVALYHAMLKTPEASEDELRALGRANARAERRLRTTRRWLLVGEAKGWDTRNTCRR